MLPRGSSPPSETVSAIGPRICTWDSTRLAIPFSAAILGKVRGKQHSETGQWSREVPNRSDNVAKSSAEVDLTRAAGTGEIIRKTGVPQNRGESESSSFLCVTGGTTYFGKHFCSALFGRMRANGRFCSTFHCRRFDFVNI